MPSKETIKLLAHNQTSAFALVLTSSLLLIAACVPQIFGPNHATISTTVEISFYRQKALVQGETRAYPTAEIQGELVLISGCLRIDVDEQQSRLMIWPDRFSFRASSTGVEILDARGQVVARVGGRVSLGGGEAIAFSKVDILPNYVDKCAGPYWIASEEVRKL